MVGISNSADQIEENISNGENRLFKREMLNKERQGERRRPIGVLGKHQG